MTSRMPASAYVHVPFCAHRCGYCDFAVIAGRDDLVERFFQALGAELACLGHPRPVDTLYIGGGTPTHLAAPQLARLGGLICQWHPAGREREWTVEANPESLTMDRVSVLADLGVTRISLGVQSLNNTKLQALDRRHSRRQAVVAAQMVQSAGLRLSIDLMFAAPNETLAQWQQDLREAIALSPDHVSTYGLTFEPGAAFTLHRDRGAIQQLDEELERAMYAKAIDALSAAGFEHYEVSNFAQPGQRCRHNEVYWAGEEYFAAGPGAARYVAGVRETNVRSTLGYLRRVETGQSLVAVREQLDPVQRARERLVLGLRRIRGVDKRTIESATRFSLDELAGHAISKFVSLGLLEEDEQSVRLTREGLFVSDALWPEFL